jgi:hypothetical protein
MWKLNKFFTVNVIVVVVVVVVDCCLLQDWLRRLRCLLTQLVCVVCLNPFVLIFYLVALGLQRPRKYPNFAWDLGHCVPHQRLSGFDYTSNTRA